MQDWEWVLKKIQELNPKSVLDVGCGNGTRVAIPAAKLGFNVTGVDIDKTSIDKAKLLSAGMKNARFLHISIENLEEKFDIVTCLETLEHLRRPDSRLLLRSIIEHGDRFIISVPNGYGLTEVVGRIGKFLRKLGLRRKKLETKYTENYSFHLQYFSYSEFKRFLASEGLVVVDAFFPKWFGVTRNVKCSRPPPVSRVVAIAPR
ncbi:methyltransferase domain-containing protein [Candidatus Woesearchaeota archaeon]|nr:methyltransferase domain-containing protein [Candidatus Woesearchaeota archaeon]